MKRIGMALALSCLIALGSAPAWAYESTSEDATAVCAEKLAVNGRSMNGRSMNGRSLNGRHMNGRSRNGRHMNGESMGDSGAMKLIGIELPGTDAMRRGR